jgi:hypothetical protein
MAIRWHTGNRCWTCNIGVKWNRRRDKLVYAQFYFTSNESESQKQAKARRERWREIKALWPDLWLAIAPAYPFADGSRPFWPDEELVETAVAETERERASIAVTVTVHHALEAYRAELRGRVGLRGVRGLKRTTLATRLYQTAGFSRWLNDADRLITLDRGRIREVVDSIWRNGTAERTMLNYTREFAAFLHWCADTEAFDWQLPKGARKLLAQRSVSPPIYVPSPAEVASMFAAAKPRWRAVMLLALNSGMTQKDIAAMAWDGGEFLTWRRSKTTHQNDFDITTWLFPETRAMLQKHGAATTSGLPLYREHESGARRDRIGEMMRRLRRRAELSASFSFKSLRKFSAQWLKDHASESVARLYLGQRIPGVLARYSRDDYAPLTVALREYRLHLLALGIPTSQAAR